MDTPISSSGLKLPLGYRFHPTDEELLLHYLKRKVMSLPLPAPAVSDFDVFGTHPLHLPGQLYHTHLVKFHPSLNKPTFFFLFKI